MPDEPIEVSDDVFSYMCTLAMEKCSKKSEKKKASCGGEAMRKRLLIKNFVAQMIAQERQNCLKNDSIFDAATREDDVNMEIDVADCQLSMVISERTFERTFERAHHLLHAEDEEEEYEPACDGDEKEEEGTDEGHDDEQEDEDEEASSVSDPEDEEGEEVEDEEEEESEEAECYDRIGGPEPTSYNCSASTSFDACASTSAGLQYSGHIAIGEELYLAAQPNGQSADSSNVITSFYSPSSFYPSPQPTPLLQPGDCNSWSRGTHMSSPKVSEVSPPRLPFYYPASTSREDAESTAVINCALVESTTHSTYLSMTEIGEAEENEVALPRPSTPACVSYATSDHHHHHQNENPSLLATNLTISSVPSLASDCRSEYISTSAAYHTSSPSKSITDLDTLQHITVLEESEVDEPCRHMFASDMMDIASDGSPRKRHLSLQPPLAAIIVDGDPNSRDTALLHSSYFSSKRFKL